MAAKNDFYVVGCKLVNGLHIRGNGKEHLINGKKDSIVSNGYALTSGVPADVWEGFVKDHGNSAVIKNGVIFAVGDEVSARDAAKERAGVKTGLEPVTAEQAGVEVDKQ